MRKGSSQSMLKDMSIQRKIQLNPYEAILTYATKEPLMRDMTNVTIGIYHSTFTVEENTRPTESYEFANVPG